MILTKEQAKELVQTFAFTVNDPESSDHGRHLIHTYSRSGIGADWDVDGALTFIDNAADVGWVNHLMGHDLQVTAGDGYRIYLQVPRPKPESLAEMIGPCRGRLYDGGLVTDTPASVAVLETAFHAVSQVSALPDNDGFMIRVWPANGTVEHGGTNLTVLTAIIRFGPDLRPVLEGFEYRPEAQRCPQP